MAGESVTMRHIEITETLVRLYVFLTQYLDRCLDVEARKLYPDEEFEIHLDSTRSKTMEILTVNPAVKGKVERECDRVLALGAACLKDGTEKTSLLEALKAERAVLKNKTIALSDLLAVFRAQ